MYLYFFSNLLIAGALATPLSSSQTSQSVWQPQVGDSWQIMLTKRINTITGPLVPSTAKIFDVDVFETPKEVISAIQAQGKKVICYFSAGSSEVWRPDYQSFSTEDKGSGLIGWRGENWLNIRSDAVMSIMRNRMQLAKDKGCDAVDPDNMDGYSNGGGGFGLTQQDTITYTKKLSAEAHRLGLSIGLKNAQSIIPAVMNDIEFAVNEGCAVDNPEDPCQEYSALLNAGKPVFHIEYVQGGVNGILSSDIFPGLSGDQLRQLFCSKNSMMNSLSTVIKDISLNGWVMLCDGTVHITASTDLDPNPADPTSVDPTWSEGDEDDS